MQSRFKFDNVMLIAAITMIKFYFGSDCNSRCGMVAGFFDDFFILLMVGQMIYFLKSDKNRK